MSPDIIYMILVYFWSFKVKFKVNLHRLGLYSYLIILNGNLVMSLSIVPIIVPINLQMSPWEGHIHIFLF